MTRIFDNIEQDLLTTLSGKMQVPKRADCFHVTDGLVSAFRLPESLLNDAELGSLANQLMTELRLGATRKTISSRQGGSLIKLTRKSPSISFLMQRSWMRYVYLIKNFA